jgi:hypothetical protein
VPRPLRLALIALGGLAVLTLVALGASAALDRPARVVTVTSSVEGSKQDVWRALTDFDAYSEWNPVFTEASGEARQGGELHLTATLPGHDPEELDAEILIFRPERKLRWQDRLLLPGVRDWEYELVLEPLADGRVRIAQLLHFEGLLAPFADTDAARQALELQAAALVERLASGQR